MKTHLKNKSIELLVCCADTNLEATQVQRLKRLAKDIRNWQPVITEAVNHRLSNFLYLNLKTHCSDLVPEDILSGLKDDYFKNSTRNLTFSAGLISILALLKKNRIAAVPFKGPVLAQQLYSDPGLRSFSDIDILVKKKDAVAARNCLIAQGFKTDVNIPDRQLNTYLEKENFFHLANASRTINIDLHWELTGRYSLRPIYFEDIENTLQELELCGKKMSLLSIEDTFIHLCIHGTSHCWEHLEMVCSIVHIIKSRQITDWDKVLGKAEKLKSRKMVLLGSSMAHKIFNVNLPDALKKQIGTEPEIEPLANDLIKNIVNPAPGFSESLSWRFSPLHICVRDNLTDKIRYGVRLFLQPTVREWDNTPLPSEFLFLYYLLRPFRILSGFLQRVFFPSGSLLAATAGRLSFFIKKKKNRRRSLSAVSFFDLPVRLIKKLWLTLAELINLYFYTPVVNANRLKQFQRIHQKKMGSHYYIIVMPNSLHLLEPCIKLLPDDIFFFLILNGVEKKEKRQIRQKLGHYPVFELKCFPKTVLQHGRVLNLLFDHNDKDFGIIDYDLYIFNPAVFKQTNLAENECMAGIYALKNKKTGLVFPTTHFLFFKTQCIKQIMKQFKIGAQEYKRIPAKLKKKLLSINLGYHNFLKDYLYYFDTLNMVMAMAFYSGKTIKIISINEKDCFHIGSNARMAGMNYMTALKLKIKENID